MKLITNMVLFLMIAMQCAFCQEKIGISYSRKNVFIGNADKIELVSNLAGNHHFLCFAQDQKPVLFIFNRLLEPSQKITLPFFIPQWADVKIIPLASFYYIYVHPQYSNRYFMWKINSNGSCTNLTDAFEKLLLWIPFEREPEFQLIPNGTSLLLTYHAEYTNLEKNTLVFLGTDSLFNLQFNRKVQYDFNRDEEQLKQEVILFGKHLLVLKTARSNTALELMKVNIATGFTIKNTYFSSGYSYAQPSITYNHSDSGIIVTALLAQGGEFATKNYVLISRMNKILIEQSPVTILKTLFNKNANTSFLLVEDQSKWMRLRSSFQRADFLNTGNGIFYQNYSWPDSNKLQGNIRPVSVTAEKKINWDESEPAVRFSLLDKNFKGLAEFYERNSKENYSIKPDQFSQFNLHNKAYLLVGQQFSQRMNGLKMVYKGEDQKLVSKDIRVGFRNDYLLSKCRVISGNSIIIPYIHRREAGLVKLTIE